MEFTPRPFEANEPEQTGESKASKKRKKKTTRVPLPVAKAEVAEEKKQTTEKKRKATKIKKPQKAKTEPEAIADEPKSQEVNSLPEADLGEQSEKQDRSKEEAKDSETNEETEPSAEIEELVLPEVEDNIEEDDSYKGELLIDHSEEPPRVAPPFPFVVNTPPAFAETPAAESVVEEPVSAEPESAHYKEAPEPESYAVLPPAPERLMSPVPESEAAAFISAPTPASAEREPAVTEKEAHDREQYAKKRGISRGVVAGGMVGWWAGRRGKAAVEREAKAAIENRDKVISRLNEEQGREREEHKKQGNILKRAQTELREIKDRIQERQQESRTIVNPIERTPEPVKPAKAVQERTPVMETTPALVFAEAVASKPETPNQELAPEDQPITEETYLIPEGRRVETSAWHRIEIDEKTGQVVEKPSVSYGEAFKREQQQEKLAHNAAAAQSAATVGMTAVMSGAEPTSYSTAVSEPSRFTLPNVPVQSIGREAIQAVRQIAQNTTEPLTWLTAFIIVVLLFVTGIIR